MRFGLFLLFEWSGPGRAFDAMYGDLLEEVAYAEEQGLEIVWLAEHHFVSYSACPQPLMFAIKAASQTRRVRFGTGVLVLPFYHPLRLAGEIAVADVLTGGRLDIGVGRGAYPYEFARYGIPFDEGRARTQESLEIILRAWKEDDVAHTGRFYQFPATTVLPRPLQQPHPPIRVAVHSGESFAHIGGLGLPIYSGTTTTPLPQLREFMAVYRARLAEAGHPWQPDQMALMLPVHIGETSAAARDAMRPGVRKYYENLRAIFSAVPDSYAEHLPRLKIIEDTLANLPYEKFFRDQAVFGDVAEVIDRLQAAVEEFGLSQVICWFDQGSMLPRAEVERTMRRFAEQVMPKL